MPYLAWDGKTQRTAVIVLPSGWGPGNPPPKPPPLVISPHGRNNFGFDNALTYWKEAPADGPFALICPDGLARAHDKASDPFDQPPSDPSLFTYGCPGYIQDLGRMASIVEATLTWLKIDLERIYVLGSSMGGLETLLVSATFPGGLLVGQHGRLAGAAAYDSPCDLATQCRYLTNRPPVGPSPPAGTAARMLEEVGSRPQDVSGWTQSAVYWNFKDQLHETIGQLLNRLPVDQQKWNARNPLAYTSELSSLGFPLRLYWSVHDIVVGNQATDQSGRLAEQLKHAGNVHSFAGDWAHSEEFKYGTARERLSEALKSFQLIP